MQAIHLSNIALIGDPVRVTKTLKLTREQAMFKN